MILFFLACASDVVFEGTLVGNAGSGKGKLAENDNITFVDSQVQVLSLSVFDQNNTEQFAQDINANILTESIPMPAGHGFRMQLKLAASTVSYLQNNVAAEYTIPQMNVDFYLNTELEPTTFLFEFGSSNWLLDADPAQMIKNKSSLFVDANGNGEIDTEERNVPIGQGENHSEEDPIDDDTQEDTGMEDPEEDDTGTEDDTGSEDTGE